MGSMSGRNCEARRAVVVEPAGPARSYGDTGKFVTFVPLSIKQRQHRKVIVPAPGTALAQSMSSLDITLVKLLGKAFYWQHLLDAGEYESGNHLARSLKLDPGWVAEVLRLTLLAPDIVEAIASGTQPRHVYSYLVKGRKGQLPREWAAQRQQLGFVHPEAEQSKK